LGVSHNQGKERHTIRPSTVGLACLFLFAVSQGLRDAFFGSVFQSVSFLFVAILAFGLTCVVFIGVSIVRRPQDLKRLAAAPVAFSCLNITTAAAWLGFFYGLRHLEPAVVATIYNGMGSLVVLLAGTLGWKAAKAESSLLERLFFVGVAAALAALVIVVLTGQSGLPTSRVGTEAVALAVVMVAGSMITIGHMIARWFNDAGVHSDAVQGTRFLLTLAAAAILEVLLGEPGTRPSIEAVPLLAVAAFALIATPSFLVQLGISRTTPLAVNVFRSLGPVFVFAVQQFDGRLRFSGATLICILVFCVCAVGASVLRGWIEAKQPINP
jgi:drug/metabolite transporter (DMT)-like permease